jgi:outer membrane protein OmpA-like peptidoglycan-associated protein
MGCEVSVFFEPDSASLSAQAFKSLNNFVSECRTSPASVIYVDGHADVSGSPERNTVISRVRAEAVRNYLLSTGVIAKAFEIRPYGDTKPLANRTERIPNEVQDKQNRRVDVRTQWPPPAK